MVMKPSAAFLWRKLDHPGHDSCRLFELPDGWRLAGMAVFRDGVRSCQLAYEVVADAGWRTRRAEVHGFIGTTAVDLGIRARGGGCWSIDGEVRLGPSPCIDLDLGFTPATNLIAIRRLALRVGERAEAPAAYVEFPRMRLVELPQLYHRTSRTTFDYQAPSVGYRGELRVSRIGAVVHYPGLFEEVGKG
jgi:hypothetical protein